MPTPHPVGLIKNNNAPNVPGMPYSEPVAEDGIYNSANPWGFSGNSLKRYRQNTHTPLGVDPTQGIEITEQQRRMHNAWLHSGNEYATGVATDDPNYKPPGEDDRLTDLQREFKKQADEFSKNAPGLKESMFNSIASQERHNLARNISGVNQSNAARGLLYSGINEGGKGAVRAESSQALAGARSKINTGVDAAERQLKYNVTAADLKQQQTNQSIQDSVYQNALESMMRRNSAMAGLFQGAGYLAGAYFGSQGGDGGGGGGAGGRPSYLEMAR